MTKDASQVLLLSKAVADVLGFTYALFAECCLWAPLQPRTMLTMQNSMLASRQEADISPCHAIWGVVKVLQHAQEAT